MLSFIFSEPTPANFIPNVVICLVLVRVILIVIYFSMFAKIYKSKFERLPSI